MMMHSLPYFYGLMAGPDAAKAIKPRTSTNIKKDLDWVEAELENKNGGWLVGQDVTAADTMMAFSIQLIFLYKVPGEDPGVGHWKRIREWLDRINQRDAYRRAVEKTNFTMKLVI